MKTKDKIIISLLIASFALSAVKHALYSTYHDQCVFPQYSAPTSSYVPDDVEVVLVENSVNTVEESQIEADPVSAEVVDPTYTQEELEILAIIIYQEAGGDACSDETRLMVGNVFLNRVEHDKFPDTFYEVATQKGQYGSLSKTGIVWPSRASNSGEKNAVNRAYAIAERLLEGERVLPSNVVFQSNFAQGDGIYCSQDNLYFCYIE